MTQEDKELLLKYLCMALPYKVVVEYINDGCLSKRELGLGSLHDFMFDNAECKPYLRPMSSMTEEEKEEERKLWDIVTRTRNDLHYLYTDFLVSHHFDFRGLIEKGLALEAPKDMYKF